MDWSGLSRSARGMVGRGVASLLVIAAWCTAALAQERDTVRFTLFWNAAPGQSVYVLGDVPELGGGDPSRSVRLARVDATTHTVDIAMPRGLAYTYRFGWREDRVPRWSDPTNFHALTTELAGETAPRITVRTRKLVHYVGDLSQPVVHWRSVDGAFRNRALTWVNSGAVPRTAGWRTWGLGQAGHSLEFYFTDALGRREPTEGAYQTSLDAIYVRDGQVFGAIPPATLIPSILRNTASFRSDILGDTRSYRVWLPRGYAFQTKRYPVLYVLDGQVVFDQGGDAWRLDVTADALIRAGQLREIIIVAVHATASRNRDYTPPDDFVIAGPGQGQEGGADRFARHLIEELKPRIDAEYRTLSDRNNTAVLGASLGGLAALYLSWDHMQVFGRCAAMSGAWQFAGFTNRLMKGPYRPIRVYLDSGDSGPIHDNAEATMRLRDTLLSKRFILGNNVFHATGYGDQHNHAAWAQRVDRALLSLFPVAEGGNPFGDVAFLADLDGDTDVDNRDAAILGQCVFSDDVRACPSITAADLDRNGVLDIRDFGRLRDEYTGPFD